ncbi:hypothetical protein CRG98_038164 [Punica granatum]|uniref:Uncharacterized protein n=1 Tax=Punica granatum TaxID=22663 RepID=A0A2I0IBS8_PUNGR|nr:hypothetical protein CRG98_038164 [Punica granatum]
MRVPKCNAAWECPPSWGRATDAREKELPLAILQPEGRGPASYPGLGAGRVGPGRDGPRSGGVDWAGMGRVGRTEPDTGWGRCWWAGPLLDWTGTAGPGR